MSALTLPKQGMTVDEFLVWAEARPGRYELHEGEVIAMSPERVRHGETKFEVATSLRDSIRRAGLPCHVLPDGMTVRISKKTAYEPDALVYCGKRLSGDATEIPNPVIVVEVFSPSTGAMDAGAKLSGYFTLPSVRHYLIVNAVERRVIHHARGAGDLIETRIFANGRLQLDPPGLELAIEDLFADK